MDKIIEVGGEMWKVSALGARHHGKIYAHLVHMTRGRHTRAGWYPAQSGQWIDEALLS